MSLQSQVTSKRYLVYPQICLITILLLMLSACGGSSSGNENVEINQTNIWNPGTFHSEGGFAQRCINPRGGINSVTGRAFGDIQGTVLDENNWLRSWSNNWYLWYKEISDQDPAGFSHPEEYFPELKTFATTSSGKAKDQFHFTIPTDEYQQQSQSGISAGYGVTFSLLSNTPPRQLVVAYTEPNSSATSVSVDLLRGTKVIEVDGYDLVNSLNSTDFDPINAGLFPQTIGETHVFKVQDTGSDLIRSITMTSSVVTSQPVQNVKTIASGVNKVGYLLFNDHIATAEQQLIEAVKQFKSEAIDELVIDLRYNGGGALYIALELGSMIAGREPINGQNLGALKYNDKHTDQNQNYLFLTHTPSFSPNPGIELPTLDLSRVFVITGSGTCSASESIINGLRGVDLEVIQIGNTTCGKPYGFNPVDNCGTTYFSINFEAVNAKGFSDYADGFSPVDAIQTGGVKLPGCSVPDDYAHQLGSTSEGRLSTSLFYIENNTCPSEGNSSKGKSSQTTVDGEIIKPMWLKNMVRVK